MKKLIFGATKSQLCNTLESNFKSAGCTSANAYDFTDTNCKVDLILPSGKHTTITAWYDYHKVKNGIKPNSVRIPWKSTFQVDPQGNVYDNGQLVGTAIVYTSTGTYQATRKNYLLRSIRTDSGDVIIDHPQSANSYNTVVQTLETRKIHRRS